MAVALSGDRHDLADAEWEVLRPALPTGFRGPAGSNNRRIMNGIFFILRTGSPWRDLPGRYGPYTTCHNRCNRWRRDGFGRGSSRIVNGLPAWTAVVPRPDDGDPCCA